MVNFFFYAALSALGVGIYRWLALRYRWLDTPNQRSSHTQMTPRGAGVVFALLILGAAIGARLALAPLLAGAIVALTGWCDDLRNVSARTRFMLYFTSACIAVASIFANHNVTIDSGFALSLPIMEGTVFVVGMVWLINLYNFMDGINGIAGIEVLFVLISIGLFSLHSSNFSFISNYGPQFIPLFSAACGAIAGFLLWNFPAGKVFMGDAGSAFLGFFVGALMLWSAQFDGPHLIVWLILQGAFIVDTTYTLVTRLATGQTWYSAHRLHAYQKLTDRFSGSHTKTVLVVLIVNLLWLLPMAWLVHIQQIAAPLGLMAAYLPLIGACAYLKAGVPEQGRV